jgi:cell division cycle protein 20 (cofactor of APC complex)
LPQVADKVLDAPDLIDDFYLNLVDWGSNNIVSVCLGTSLYLWNANTSKICELFNTAEKEQQDNFLYPSAIKWI